MGPMLLFVGAALFTGPEPSPRGIKIWTYQKLHEKADLAAIVSFASDRVEKDEPIDPELQGRTYVESLTVTLRLLSIIKGDPKKETVELRHHRLKKGERLRGDNAPGLVEFRPREDYLVFLKKRPDGRFECLSGHLDPDGSVKRLASARPRDDRADK